MGCTIRFNQRDYPPLPGMRLEIELDMYIREATINDNAELIALQARCPQGTTVIVSTINTPDFFARAKVYEDFKVFAVCEDNRIIASAACGVRNVIIGNTVAKVGHEFQAFVDPQYRGRRIAGELIQVREEYVRKRGAILSYGLIMEGNKPSMRHIERQGFTRHRTLVMPSIAVFKEMDIAHTGAIRHMVPEDLPGVVSLINDTWKEYEFYEPMTAEEFNQLIARTPAYNYDNVLLLEEAGEIIACLGFWDWSNVTQVTVKRLSFKMHGMSFLINAARIFRPLPRPPRPGSVLKQIMLTPIGFKDMQYIPTLLRYVNNRAYAEGIESIFFICERDHPLSSTLRGFIHIDTGIHLYIKPLNENVSLSGKPVFINGLDL
jgi:GNAT superfamily N-acetyltransferase